MHYIMRSSSYVIRSADDTRHSYTYAGTDRQCTQTQCVYTAHVSRRVCTYVCCPQYGWPGSEDELSMVIIRAARQHLASQSISVNTAGEAALARTMEVADRWVTWGDATVRSYTNGWVI